MELVVAFDFRRIFRSQLFYSNLVTLWRIRSALSDNPAISRSAAWSSESLPQKRRGNREEADEAEAHDAVTSNMAAMPQILEAIYGNGDEDWPRKGFENWQLQSTVIE